MSVFDLFTKKVSQTAKAAAKKSGDIVGVTKLNLSIGAEEDKIKKAYSEIGRIVFESFKRGERLPGALVEECEEISAYEKNIEDMKLKILELKNQKMCPSCGSELEIHIAFCPNCGTKQEIPAPRPEIEPEIEKEAETENKTEDAEEKGEAGEE